MTLLRWGSRAALALVVAACGGVPLPPIAAQPEPADMTAALERIQVTCGSDVPFDPALLDRPGDAEQAHDPTAAALRIALAEPGIEVDMLPDDGWIRVGETATTVEFVARTPLGGFTFASIGKAAGERRFQGFGECRPETALPAGIGPGRWRLGDGVRRDPAMTSFTALVTELSCASGKLPGDRLLAPVIAYQPDRVLVLFGVRDPAGGMQSCQGNPETAVEVALAEPLGARTLGDAATYPPADPTEPIFG